MTWIGEQAQAQTTCVIWALGTFLSIHSLNPTNNDFLFVFSYHAVNLEKSCPLPHSKHKMEGVFYFTASPHLPPHHCHPLPHSKHEMEGAFFHLSPHLTHHYCLGPLSRLKHETEGVFYFTVSSHLPPHHHCPFPCLKHEMEGVFLSYLSSVSRSGLRDRKKLAIGPDQD